MNVADLPPFDPAIHLTAADLRALERRYDYDEPAHAVERTPERLGPGSAGKILKARFETRMLADAVTRFAAIGRDHPPYGLPMPPPGIARVLAPVPQAIEVDYLGEEETPASMTLMSMNTLHALSDLKLQLLINQLLLEAQSTGTFNEALPAGSENARIVTNGRTDNWKFTIQSAASNAKRSEFIVLKQILLRWAMATSGGVPTRTQFLDIARNSAELLETLATTHQAVFSVVNIRIIKDASGDRYHRLVQEGGKPRIALDRSILDGLDIPAGQPAVRTMCAALLAKDEEGVSLLERSYDEDARMAADVHFDGENARPRHVINTLNSRLPEPSVHMYLKLKAFSTGNG